MSKRSRKGIKNKRGAFVLLEDILMISAGIVIALFFVKSGLLDSIIDISQGYYFFSAFLAGVFFTSAFTLAPSSIALIHIAQNSPIDGVALFGALGAMCGDLILLFFIRDRFAEDIMKVMRPSTVKYILKSLHFGFMRWLSPLLGAVIIASPLPDEFGITLLGMSKIKLGIFLPIAFIMNALGIYLLIGFSSIL
jgi:hypothetical protein